MFKFENQQQLVQIGNVTFGGQSGEYPTVLCGSIFYGGHVIVSDPEKGIFDESAARELLSREAELSAQTGNPRVIDVVGDTADALTRYVEFVASHTDCPILVDSPQHKPKIEVFRRFAGSEITDRLIYNSIDVHHTEEDLAGVAEAGVRSAVVLAFSTRALRPADKIKLLNGGKPGEEGLLAKARRVGIENIIVDVGCLDVPGTAWSSVAVNQVKAEVGLPAGLAPSNALHGWLKGTLKTERGVASATAVYSLPIFWGADFIFYGPIRHANWVYPAAAAADAMVAYGGKLHGVRPKTEGHPLFKIF